MFMRRLPKVLLQSLLLIVFLSVPSLAQYYGEVPLFRGKQGKALVMVNVDGRGRYPFMLDTGAEDTVVLQSLVDMLQLSPAVGKGRTISTGNGAVRARAYTIGDLFIGNMRMPTPTAIALPSRKGITYKGVIGGPLFKDVSAEFNFDDKKLRIYKRGHKFDESEWQKLKGVKLEKTYFTVPITVEGKEIIAFVDTGANRTLINAEAAELLGIGTDGRPTANVDVTGGGNKSSTAKRFRVSSFFLGPHDMESRKLYSADIPFFRSINLHDKPAAILGMDVLQHFNFVVDAHNSRMFLKGRVGIYPSYD